MAEFAENEQAAKEVGGSARHITPKSKGPADSHVETESLRDELADKVGALTTIAEAVRGEEAAPADARPKSEDAILRALKGLASDSQEAERRRV